MKTTIQYNGKNYKIDLSEPIDISIAISGRADNVNAWYVGHPVIAPWEYKGNKVSLEAGAAVNFNNIEFNPHAHGTHTETVWHILNEEVPVDQVCKKYFFKAEVITVVPEKQGTDWVISKKQVQYALGNKKREAVVIRTLPNLADKKQAQYSHTNPPYLAAEAAAYLRDKGVVHLLIDLPSLDKENDNGLVAAHHAFWNTADAVRYDATITELIFVPNSVEDGVYFLELQIAAFENDAAPSRPVLYKVN